MEMKIKSSCGFTRNVFFLIFLFLFFNFFDNFCDIYVIFLFGHRFS